MPRREMPLFAAVVATAALTSAIARADDGVDYAFELRRVSWFSMTSSPGALTLSVFDPGDPRVGLTLLAAYGPTPMLLIEGVAADELNDRPFTIAEVVASAVGSAAAAWGLVDALQRETDADVAIGSLASAHALSWNLQLMSSALSRLVFQSTTPRVEPPTFLVFPIDGGAGLTLRWQD